MTESPAGGLPLGLLVLSNHTEATLSEGIQDLKALMPENAFYGRGKVGWRMIFKTKGLLNLICKPLS